MRERYLEKYMREDLKDKMVFITGPRQVGKTTLALKFLSPATEENPAYFNWDDVFAREKILRSEISFAERIIVFDEIHKFSRWKSLIKGFYDVHKKKCSFMVTGSARLDVYKRGGDSLQGRYYNYRLHPFSLREISAQPTIEDLYLLLKFGGFPEPFLKADEREWRRWQLLRKEKVLHQDIRDLENIRDISLVELLIGEIPNRVGAPLSIKNLREQLQIAHETCERYVQILEKMYYCFRIAPYGSSGIKAVQKEKKLYLWDWSLVEDAGYRFENFVACQLLKYCHFNEDVEGYKMELKFLRDMEKREVDFVVLKDGKPVFAVECKTGEKSANPACYYFKSRTPIPRFYQVHLGKKDYGNEETSVRVLPFIRFCAETGMP